MREQERFLDANFEKLSERHLQECSEIKSLFYKKNVVIVGAGPSVNQELPSLKQYRNNITIFATGHIAGTLLREGIYPECYHHNRSTAAYVSAGEGTWIQKDSIDTSVDSVLVCSGLL